MQGQNLYRMDVEKINPMWLFFEYIQCFLAIRLEKRADPLLLRDARTRDADIVERLDMAWRSRSKEVAQLYWRFDPRTLLKLDSLGP